MTYPLFLVSRRGLTRLSEVSVLITHPEHIHVPRPSRLIGTPCRPSGRQVRPFREEPRTRKYLKQPAPLSEIFPKLIIRRLQDAGLLAAALSGGRRKWDGMALIPERISRSWAPFSDRKLAIQMCDGEFRKINIKYVVRHDLLSFEAMDHDVSTQPCATSISWCSTIGPYGRH